MKRRLLVLTELIAPYRIPVFNALAKRVDVDLHVIFLSRTDASIRQWRVYEEEIRFSYRVLPSWRRRIGKYNLLLNQAVTKALHQFSPDVIVCGGYNYIASWQAMAWARRHHVPFLLWCESTARDRRTRNPVLRLLKRKFFGYCAGFVVPGTSAAEYLEKFGVDRERILLAPNAVDTELFSGCGKAALRNAARLRAELTLPDRYFLYVGRLVQSKGVLDLLDAYRSIPAELRSQVGLVLAGDGPLRSELEARAREISPGCVSFSGFVHREDLATYYSLAECLVLPTLSDTWGLVVNEAMACGLPVICTEVAGCAADLVQNSGILVPPGDPKQLSEAMQTMASDRVSRDAMSCVAANLIQFYSPEVCAAGLAQASLASGAHVA